MERYSESQPPPALVQETIPGTEMMQDGDHGIAQMTGRGIILVPQPSDDPADPLNWSGLRKALAGASLALYTFLTTTSALSMSPMFPLFAETFTLSETQVPLITGVTVMVLGFSNFIVIPFSNVFGRRAAALTFGVLFLVTCIWQAVAKSSGSFMASRAIIGIAAAPSETLMVQVIADIFFLHERGLWVGIYFASFSLGAFIGPVISGNIAERHGWRSFLWLSTGLIAFNLILLLVFFPETKYNREQSVSTQSIPLSQSGDEGTDASTKIEEAPMHVEMLADTETVRKGRPSAKQYLLIQRPHNRWKYFLARDFVVPVRVACFPIVLFAALNLMGGANMVLFWNLTETTVLGSPPYKFSTSQVGFANFGFAAGALLGMVTAGPFSDWVVQRATAKNNGVREAEMRLPALIPFIIISVIGTVIGGVAMRGGWHWPVLVVIGYGSAGMTMTTVPAIAIAYAVDSYKPISGEIMIVGTVLKNTTGFGMTYWVPPMIVKDGYITPLMIWFVFTITPMLLAIPLYFWGKRLRVATKNSSVHKYERLL